MTDRRRRGWAAPVRWRFGLAAGLCVAVLGCTHAGQTLAEPPATDAEPAATEPDVAGADMAPPATLKNVLVQPWSGLALQKASSSLADVVAGIETPDYLAEGIKRLERGRKPREPRASTIQRYVQARDAYYQRDFNEALRLVDKVIEQDADAAEPHVLRGRIMLDAVGADSARRSFAAALRRDPNHPDALFIEGRLAFNARSYGTAALLLHRLVGLDPADRAIDRGVQYIGRYYLGQSLLRQGYDAAGVECLDAYVQKEAGFGGITNLGRQAAAVARQRGPTLLQLGDALVRLGRAGDALARYDEAAETERIDASVINSRRVYALMLLGRAAEAERVTVAELSREGARSDSLLLVEYVARHSDDRDRFAAALRKAYDAGNDRELLAEAVVRSLGDDQAVERFIAADLARHPRHTGVFDALLERLGPDRLDKAVAATVGLIEQAPGRAGVFADRLLDRKVDRDRWIEAIDALPAARRDTAAGWYLRGVVELKDNDADGAAKAFEHALDHDPDFAPAVVSKVELAIRVGDLDRAMELIEAHDAAKIPRLKYLAVVTIDRLARRADAKKDDAAAREYRKLARQTLDELIEASPADPELLLMRSTLQRDTRDFAGAEQTLLRLISINSTYEPAYAALFRIYEREARDPKKFVQLLARARVAIPNARITRYKLAQVHRIRGELNNAEDLLRQLVVEDPRDATVLRELVTLLTGAGRDDDAYETLEKVLDGDPESLAALLLLEELANQRGDTEPFLVRYEAYLNRLRDGLGKQMRLASLYGRWGKPTKQIAALQAALGYEPEDAAPVHRQLALVYASEKRFDEAVASAERAVALKPGDAANHATRGFVLYQADRGDEAVEAYRAAIAARVADEGDLRTAFAELLFTLGRVDDALDELDRAIVAAPAKRIDLLYRKANYAHDDPPRAEKLLKAILAEKPDHAGANNDLGYSWADAGRNLAEAEQMIRRAVAARPAQPAYLDSLGWVLYKRGEFDQAKAWLLKAYGLPGGQDAVIVDHLGDALWRTGATDDAVEKWKQAAEALRKADADKLRDHEKDLIKALDGKVRAARAGHDPDIAPVPDAAEDGPPPDAAPQPEPAPMQ